MAWFIKHGTGQLSRQERGLSINITAKKADSVCFAMQGLDVVLPGVPDRWYRFIIDSKIWGIRKKQDGSDKSHERHVLFCSYSLVDSKCPMANAKTVKTDRLLWQASCVFEDRAPKHFSFPVILLRRAGSQKVKTQGGNLNLNPF